MLHRLSAAWARIELICAAVLAGLVSVLILLNVITRSMRMALYWVDEAAIYAMVLMTFLAASAAIERRESISITLIMDLMRPRVQAMFWLFVDLITALAAVLLVWFTWRWFDPVTLAQVGFDFRAFQGETFNFIYAEPTSTLGIRKFWVWLIMPVFTLGFLLHATSNLVKTLRGQTPDAPDPADREREP